jgi:eukaryotic-like serine/threonine-protein kinase
MSSSSRGPGYGAVILVSALTSAAVSGGFVFAMVEGWRLLPDEEVPELTGLSADAARGMLDSRGLRFVHRGERHDDVIEEGLIVEQQPGHGSLVPSGSEVTVLLSLGPDTVEVPNVIGLTVGPATAQLTNAGLRVARELHEAGTGEPGTISSTSPSAGQHVSRDTEVFLTTVPERRLVVVPDLTGVSTRVARETIAAAGLVVGETRHGFDDVRSPFTVLRQSPAPGTEVEPGSAIEITVNDE